MFCRQHDKHNMREWLSGGASPCQGEGRGFDPRLALLLFLEKPREILGFLFFCCLNICRHL